MKVLGFSGKARHGKDTCASIAKKIAKDHGVALGSWAFAHPLKAIVFGEGGGLFTFEEVFNTKPPQVRKALQIRGTENGRDKFGESLWTLQAEAYLNLFSQHLPVDGVVFTDVRFPNEVDFVRAGGKDVRTFVERKYATAMAAAGYPGFELDLEGDGEYSPEVLELSMSTYHASLLEANNLLDNPDGMALRIKSDRPTLTGEASRHSSETALDELEDSEFDGVIVNDMTTTFEDLEEQLTPYIKKLFNLD